jgi:hypothetical protein
MGSTARGMLLPNSPISGAKCSLRLTIGVTLIGSLAALTNVRIGSLQPEDIALLFLLALCCGKFCYSGFSLRLATKLSPLFKWYLFLLLVLCFLSFYSVRLPFFSLQEASFLKRPIIFSLSKLLQLSATICGFFWLSNSFLKNNALLIAAIRAYWICGLFCALFALGSYIFIALTHYDPSPLSILGAYYTSPGNIRARGFFNEGGPFGIYIVSVFVIGLLRRHLIGQKLGKLQVAILSFSFILASSKAGFMAALFLFLFSTVMAASFTKKIVYFVLSFTLLSSLAVALNFNEQLYAYLNDYQNLEQVISVRGLDYNVVLGRVAALYIVPRMIASHPWTGIGFGNYPLMRNDPHYLGILPSVRHVEDVPGIGIPGIAAEMGIPATLLLVALLLSPVWWSRKQTAIVGVAALFQCLAHAFAVQLTFFYPWFVSACAVGALSYNMLKPKDYTHNLHKRFLMKAN